MQKGKKVNNKHNEFPNIMRPRHENGVFLVTPTPLAAKDFKLFGVHFLITRFAS